jgi:hypothetical protein
MAGYGAGSTAWRQPLSYRILLGTAAIVHCVCMRALRARCGRLKDDMGNNVHVAPFFNSKAR